jgi:type II secretory pathway component GspD/PulD (secretin)
VKELDIPVASSPQAETRSIRFKHLPPKEAASHITELLGVRSVSRTATTTSRPTRIPRRIPSGASVEMVPHEATSSLLIRATPDVFKQIEQILELIDVPPQEKGEKAETE